MSDDVERCLSDVHMLLGADMFRSSGVLSVGIKGCCQACGPENTSTQLQVMPILKCLKLSMYLACQIERVPHAHIPLKIQQQANNVRLLQCGRTCKHLWRLGSGCRGLGSGGWRYRSVLRRTTCHACRCRYTLLYQKILLFENSILYGCAVCPMCAHPAGSKRTAHYRCCN